MAETPNVTVELEVDTSGFDPLAVMSAQEEREAYLDGILQGALDRAQAFIRAGRVGRAEYELVRAELRVARILGDVEAVERLEQLRYFEIGGK